MRFNRHRVIVLGAGPAGLLAAHAAQGLGHNVEVFTAPDGEGRPRKSELHGCQYLHKWIPDVGIGPAGRGVSYQLTGTTEDYRRKVYGDNWSGEISPDEYGPDEYGPERSHQAWDLRKAYDSLWEHWRHRITPMSIGPKMAERIALTKGQRVVCTIPAKALCLAPENHKFVSQSIWAMGTRADVDPVGWSGSPRPPYIAPDMTVQCNGTRDTGWYRAATVFGQSTLEWPGGAKPPIRGVAAVSKPLSTDCTCHTGPRWHRVGRYGLWRKGVLVHQAYEDTKTVLG